MKKKFLLSALTVVFMFAFVAIVNARTTVLNIGFDVAGKAPATVPGDNTVVYSTVTEPFDFSRVVFETSGGGTMYGDGFMRKILVSSSPNWLFQPGGTDEGITALGSYFSAYCLDGELKYPLYGVYAAPQFLSAYTNSDYAAMFQQIVIAALTNKAEIRSALATAANEADNDPVVDFEVTGEDDQTMAAILGRINGTDTAAKLTTNKVNINSITYGSTTITAAQLNAAAGKSGSKYLLEFNGMDVAFQTAVAKAPENNSYDKALWIIEHSYPTLPLVTALEAAGADYDALSAEIVELQKQDTNDVVYALMVSNNQIEDSKDTNLSGEKLSQYIENYVYNTVQYAIWQVYDGKHDSSNNSLGSAITNVSELNKLYQYLINVPTDLSGYADSTMYTNEVTVTAPENGKEIDHETDDYYFYGPYVAKYSALSNDDISLAITNEDKTGISFVKSDGTEITSVPNGGAFYIKVSKKAKIASVTGTASVANVSTFSPVSDRARVYTSVYPLSQNLMSGGKLNVTNISTNFSDDYNAKTGVENVAMLLMVTLVAFSLGYMVLSFKAKPLGL